MDKYKIGVIQMDTGPDKQDNLRRAAGLTEKAVEEGAAIISLPEVFDIISPGPISPEPVPGGETAEFLRGLAMKYHIWVHGGSFRETNPQGGKYYNTTLLMNPQGEIKATYRKLHLYDVDIEKGPSVKESDNTSPGNKIVTVSTDLGRFGLSICYDLRFPELYRLMALQGAEVLFVPANFAHPTGVFHWETLLRARAIENRCYVVAAAQTGIKPKYIAHGMSMVVDPWGKIVNQADYSEGFFVAEIDISMVAPARTQLPTLQNRRSDIYRLELMENPEN